MASMPDRFTWSLDITLYRQYGADLGRCEPSGPGIAGGTVAAGAGSAVCGRIFSFFER
jgi:hypothetical protein